MLKNIISPNKKDTDIQLKNAPEKSLEASRVVRKMPLENRTRPQCHVIRKTPLEIMLKWKFGKALHVLRFSYFIY